MKQFTKLNVKIARLFILVKRVKSLEIEWKNTKDASDVDMKILKFTKTWNKPGTSRNLESFHSYMNDNSINRSLQIPDQYKLIVQNL